MAHLQQIQVQYDQLQDRLVLILYTQEWDEYRFWITRKVVQVLWKIFSQLLQKDEKNRNQHMKTSEEIQKKIEQEKMQRRAEAEKYSRRLTRKPLGDEPVLILKIMAKPLADGNFQIHLQDNMQHSIGFGGNNKILIALCELIQRGVQQAEWGLNLK